MSALTRLRQGRRGVGENAGQRNRNGQPHDCTSCRQYSACRLGVLCLDRGTGSVALGGLVGADRVCLAHTMRLHGFTRWLLRCPSGQPMPKRVVFPRALAAGQLPESGDVLELGSGGRSKDALITDNVSAQTNGIDATAKPLRWRSLLARLTGLASLGHIRPCQVGPTCPGRLFERPPTRAVRGLSPA